ncbi:hypothetical protein [Burkholderia sp. S-53]|uniref:hypothetical protein n=1 Tax=Burkholderia sp. S-53 TaxID=2906514 RepID=UPI0021CED806|nr:hypothetical protein [Burkholderia sp. S-53]UXU85650.1 hypothetical protein LXM88_04605 [Burkholderia sp. S-53]
MICPFSESGSTPDCATNARARSAIWAGVRLTAGFAAGAVAAGSAGALCTPNPYAVAVAMDSNTPKRPVFIFILSSFDCVDQPTAILHRTFA